MDINCGDVMDGDATLESKGKEIFDMMHPSRFGRKIQERGIGRRQRRNSALDDRRSDVMSEQKKAS